MGLDTPAHQTVSFMIGSDTAVQQAVSHMIGSDTPVQQTASHIISLHTPVQQVAQILALGPSPVDGDPLAMSPRRLFEYYPVCSAANRNTDDQGPEMNLPGAGHISPRG
ncbi:uncharacterized protein LOC130357272 isoform X3 [Hyla sarda]|uniref:uncharacterized protein LOC130357272 isoform X3 n=1 Tax=Hyla sarda TaxID=327740 RepID=UPI0024C45AE4|nr:uncharacterized protein LOC130357272 isoform X3 [Hyla sarda]